MSRWSRKATIFLIAALLTVVVTALRVTLVPWLQNGPAALYGYAVIVLFIAGMLSIWLLLYKESRTFETLPSVTGEWVNPVCFVLMVVGVCVLFSTGYDIYQYLALGVAPPPAEAIGGGVDRITLCLSFVSGVGAGIYFILLGVLWFIKGENVRGLMPFMALTPTFWVWMRLARYEVSYASAVELHRSFYDFAMLLLSMLFLFAFARQMANVQPKTAILNVFFALCTMVLNLSGFCTKTLFFFMGDGDAYDAGQLAGMADLAIGILAGMFAVQWLFARAPKMYTPITQSVLNVDGETPIIHQTDAEKEQELEELLNMFTPKDSE